LLRADHGRPIGNSSSPTGTCSTGSTLIAESFYTIMMAVMRGNNALIAMRLGEHKDRTPTPSMITSISPRPILIGGYK
jgi:uncharacterized membrane protein YidH (DUF202 family)